MKGKYIPDGTTVKWPSEALAALEREAWGDNPPEPTHPCSACGKLCRLTVTPQRKDGSDLGGPVCGDCADIASGRRPA